MNKKIISLVVLVGLFCLVGVALGQITAPLGVPKTFPELFTKIATAVGGLIAGLGTVMIIIAGILYLTSAGSPERVGTAKKALIYAVIGIAVGLAAVSIVNIVKNIVA